MARLETLLGDYVIAAVLTALENDPSRDALSDPASLQASGLFAYRVPSAYLLRLAMQRTDLRDALAARLRDMAQCVYDLERWYVVDCTYFKTPYYRKTKWVRDTDGKMVLKKIKCAKVYIARGLVTGVPVAWTVCDDYTSDQTQFVPIFNQIVFGGGTVRGGGILGDCGFNANEHYEMVARAGGRAFLDFDSDAKSTNGRFPHRDEQLDLYKKNRDEWQKFAGWRSLIETTNHAIKTPIKAVLRAQQELPRETEMASLLFAYSLTRVPELRLKHRIALPPFADLAATEFIDAAIRRKRRRAA